MTWRERIVRARARGAFTWVDRVDAAGWQKCAVGECVQRYGFTDLQAVLKLKALDFADGKSAGGRFATAVGSDDFDAAENLLERIEDRALALKREAQP